jgi:hypothetical protein
MIVSCTHPVDNGTKECRAKSFQVRAVSEVSDSIRNWHLMRKKFWFDLIGMNGERALLREELIAFDAVVEKAKMCIVVVYSLENEN